MDRCLCVSFIHVNASSYFSQPLVKWLNDNHHHYFNFFYYCYWHLCDVEKKR